MAARVKNAQGAAVYHRSHASSKYMRAHNVVVRGETEIHTRYVGVWCFITSHVDGWRLTEKKIAEKLGVGRDFVRAALANIEEAGCLIRSQERASGGMFGESVWFITDLPFELQSLGVVDRDEIRARVFAEYEEFALELAQEQNGWSGPLSENPASVDPASLVDNSAPPPPVGNPTDIGKPDSGPDQGKQSDPPLSGFPMSGKRTTDNPTPKKTKVQKTNPRKSQPANQPPSGGGDPGWLVGTPVDDKPAVDLLRGLRFPKGAQPLAAAAVDRYRIVVRSALEAGMSTDRVRRFLTDNLDGTTNPAGVVVRRLQDLAVEVQHWQQERELKRRQAQDRADQQVAAAAPKPTPDDLADRVPDAKYLPSRLRVSA